MIVVQKVETFLLSPSLCPNHTDVRTHLLSISSCSCSSFISTLLLLLLCFRLSFLKTVFEEPLHSSLTHATNTKYSGNARVAEYTTISVCPFGLPITESWFGGGRRRLGSLVPARNEVQCRQHKCVVVQRQRGETEGELNAQDAHEDAMCENRAQPSRDELLSRNRKGNAIFHFVRIF